MVIKNNNDIYLKYDMSLNSIEEFEAGDLYLNGDFNSGLNISTNSRKLCDSRFYGLLITTNYNL